MATYVFEKFNEIEDTLQNSTPPIIYKYRSDWNNVFHKEFVTKQTIWFAAPSELNDPYDISTPIKFNYDEISHPLFLEKMKKIILENNPGIIFSERDLIIISENRLDEIKKDPKAYFEKNITDLRKTNIYDRVGLFSCTEDGLNETMWAHYANNSKGFAVGFNTVELSRELYCSIGPVNYTDEIPLYSLISKNTEVNFDSLFVKSKKWQYEKEFRYITIADNIYFNRVKIYPTKCVVKFILGTHFPENQKEDFITEVRKIFPKEIKIYQAILKASGYGLEEKVID